MDNIRVLIAEGDDIPLAGLRTLLELSPDLEVAGTAESAKQLLDLVPKRKADILLLSTSLPGLNLDKLFKRLSSEKEPPRIVLLSPASEPAPPSSLKQSGITAWLPADIRKDELHAVLADAARGVSRLPWGNPDRKEDHADRETGKKTGGKITRREAEVMKLIVEGYTSREIARMLFISPRTVETHRSNLMQKLNLRNTAGLVRYAIRQGDVALTDH